MKTQSVLFSLALLTASTLSALAQSPGGATIETAVPGQVGEFLAAPDAGTQASRGDTLTILRDGRRLGTATVLDTHDGKVHLCITGDFRVHPGDRVQLGSGGAQASAETVLADTPGDIALRYIEANNAFTEAALKGDEATASRVLEARLKPLMSAQALERLKDSFHKFMAEKKSKPATEGQPNAVASNPVTYGLQKAFDSLVVAAYSQQGHVLGQKVHGDSAEVKLKVTAPTETGKTSTGGDDVFRMVKEQGSWRYDKTLSQTPVNLSGTPPTPKPTLAMSKAAPVSVSPSQSELSAGWVPNATGVTVPDAPLSGNLGGTAFKALAGRMTNGAMGTEIFIQGERGSDFSIQFIGNVRLALGQAFMIRAVPGNTNPFIQRRWQNPAVRGQTVCVGNDANYSMQCMLFREGATTKLRLYWCDRDASHSFVAGVVNISGGP